jgi:predicted MFS family arabinose efflux permease
MVVPFMSLYLTSPKMGYSIGQAGFVYGLFGAGAFSGAWIGGKLTDRIGFYPVQLITLLGGGVLFILLGQMKTFPLICLFTFILSFVNEAFRPANSTAIAFYSKEENRTRSYSLNRLAINLGWALGSAIGGIIAKYSYESLFWVDGCTNIAAALLMWWFVKPVNYTPVHQQKQAAPKSESVFRDKGYLWFILFVILFACCFFQLFTNLSVYYKLRLGFSEPFIGFLMSTNGLLIVAIEMVLIYKLDGKRRSTYYIVIGVLLMGMAFLLLTLLPMSHAMALLLVIVITFGEMTSMPFMNSFWISRTKPHNRGQYAALYTMAWSAAQTLGPMGGAQAAEHWGFHCLWWIISGLSLVTAFSFWRLHRMTGQEGLVLSEEDMPAIPVEAPED